MAVQVCPTVHDLGHDWGRVFVPEAESVCDSGRL